MHVMCASAWMCAPAHSVNQLIVRRQISVEGISNEGKSITHTYHISSGTHCSGMAIPLAVFTAATLLPSYGD